jgi:hypothetical protein
MPLLLVTIVLSDNTQVTLKETAGEECHFHLIIAGKVECSYDTFEFAWEDLGRCVACSTLEESHKVARS